MQSKIAWIGQRRNVSGLAGYGLGDAQIDAQNRATNDIGAIKESYNAVKAAGSLTASYIQSARDQIQRVIDNYDKAYGSTDRGKAGTGTLQRFVNSRIYTELDADLQNAVDGFTEPAFVDNSGGYTPGIFGGSGSKTTINIGPGTTAESSGAMQPSGTPGPPSGIQIPGYETTVTADAPAWYENPTMLILAGLAVAVFLGSKGKNH